MHSSSLLRTILPSAMILLATLLGLARLPLIEWLPIAPGFSFITIFYWTMARPSRISALLLFLLGLIVDSVGTTALGTHALLFIGFYLLTRLLRLRIETMSLSAVWIGFALSFFLLCVVYWIAIGMQQPEMPPLASLLGYWLVSVLAYPLLHMLYDRLLRRSQQWKL